jgi:hypothetical protein
MNWRPGQRGGLDSHEDEETRSGTHRLQIDEATRFVEESVDGLARVRVELRVAFAKPAETLPLVGERLLHPGQPCDLGLDPRCGGVQPLDMIPADPTCPFRRLNSLSPRFLGAAAMQRRGAALRQVHAPERRCALGAAPLAIEEGLDVPEVREGTPAPRFQAVREHGLELR